MQMWHLCCCGSHQTSYAPGRDRVASASAHDSVSMSTNAVHAASAGASAGVAAVPLLMPEAERLRGATTTSDLRRRERPVPNQ